MKEILEKYCQLYDANHYLYHSFLNFYLENDNDVYFICGEYKTYFYSKNKLISFFKSLGD